MKSISSRQEELADKVSARLELLYKEVDWDIVLANGHTNDILGMLLKQSLELEGLLLVQALELEAV